MNPMKLSEHLLELRHKRDVTQDELAAFKERGVYYESK